MAKVSENSQVNVRLALRMANIVVANKVRNNAHMSGIEIQSDIELLFAVNMRLLGEDLTKEQNELLN